MSSIDILYIALNATNYKEETVLPINTLQCKNLAFNARLAKKIHSCDPDNTIHCRRLAKKVHFIGDNPDPKHCNKRGWQRNLNILGTNQQQRGIDNNGKSSLQRPQLRQSVMQQNLDFI